jgi:PAS domain S-box-containing protein
MYKTETGQASELARTIHQHTGGPCWPRDDESENLPDDARVSSTRAGETAASTPAGEPAMTIPPGLADALLATASDAIIATDRDGLVTFWNPGAARIFGFAVAEAMGQSLDIIIPENLRARHWDGYRQVMATGESRYGQGDLLAVPAVTKDGRRISVEFTIVMLRDAQGRPTGTAAILRDVTKSFEEKLRLRKAAAQVAKAV